MFRVWAPIRADEMRGWLRRERVPPPDALAGAELRAAELALTLDLADEVAGLTVDWSKCYGRVPLAMVEALTRATRVHPAVWRPLLAAYWLPRRVRADGLAGSARTPVRGPVKGVQYLRVGWCC